MKRTNFLKSLLVAPLAVKAAAKKEVEPEKDDRLSVNTLQANTSRTSRGFISNTSSLVWPIHVQKGHKR